MKYFQLVIIFLIASSSFSQSIVAEGICIENSVIIKSKNTSYNSDNIFSVLFSGNKYMSFNVRGLPENLGTVSKFKVHILDSNNVKCEYRSLARGSRYLGGEKVKKPKKYKNKSGMKKKNKYVKITSRLRNERSGSFSYSNYGFRLSPGNYQMYVDFTIDGQRKSTGYVSLIVL